jgi:membrane protease YdiL (CAAX protease family)
MARSYSCATINRSRAPGKRNFLVTSAPLLYVQPMSFLAQMRTNRLSEKPWRAEAIGRLIASVIICIFIGATVMSVIQYFDTSQKSSGLFLRFNYSAIAAYISAIVLLIKPWHPEKFLLKLIALLCCIYGGLLCNWLAHRLVEDKGDLQNPVLTMLASAIFFQGAAILLTHFFLRSHQTNWREGFGLANDPFKCVLLGTGIGLIALVPTLELQAICIRLFESLTLHPQQQEAVTILSHIDSLPQRALLGVSTIFVAPIGEEILFRGILYPAIKRFNPQLALWATSILFGLIHTNLASFVPLTLLAVLLVYVYEYTGNLLAPIAVHCVFNAANFIALYLVRDTLPV